MFTWAIFAVQLAQLQYLMCSIFSAIQTQQLNTITVIVVQQFAFQILLMEMHLQGGGHWGGGRGLKHHNAVHQNLYSLHHQHKKLTKNASEG